MDLEDTKRDILPTTLEELKLIVEAVDFYYKRRIIKAQRSKGPRSIKTTQELAKIQMLAQYVTLCYNLRTNKVNEALLESVEHEEKASANTGEEKLDGGEGEKESLS